jgi:A118 family predicted phage portal protein
MLEILQDGNDKFMAFDDNDTEFYGMKNDSLTDIKEINMELRIEQHDQGLQRFLNLLSTKCGLGNDRYKFDAGGVKTATEIISEKSELFQNLKKNELVLDAAIGGLCRAVADITGAGGDFEVKVNFDDSIIEDSDAKRTRIQALVTQGKFPLWRYLHEYEGYDEDEAKDIALEAEDEAAAAAAPKDGITYPDEPQVPGSAAGGAGGAAQAAAGGKEPAAAE